MLEREIRRQTRHRRIRKRMAVFRSHKHLYIQFVNDMENKILLTCTTQAAALKTKAKSGGTVAAAEQLGKHAAAEAVKRGIQQVMFDRGGYHYHGRVKAVAEAARAGGLQF